MSSTQVTESAKPLCLSIRVIEAKLYTHPSVLLNPKISLKLGGQSWLTPAATGEKNSPQWEQFHSFEILDSHVLTISLLHTPLFLSQKLIGTCSLKIPIENAKSTNWYELSILGKTTAKVLISFLIDEKGENNYQVLHSLDLEKEQIRYYKNKYLQKLTMLKAEKKGFRKTTSVFLSKVKEQFETSTQYQGLVKERSVVREELKKLIEEHRGIKSELSNISVGYVKRQYSEMIPRHVSRILSKSSNNCN